jgi:hypothetical protein
VLLPPGDPPEPVRKAIAAVERSRSAAAKLAAQEARQAVADAERADVAQMSKDARAGKVPTSDMVSVEQARAHAAAVERQHEAILEAIRSAEAELGEACESSRGDWLALVEKRQAEARGKARSIVAELEGALNQLGEANSAWPWLQPRGGLDGGRRPGVPMVAPPRSSARLTANSSALTVVQVVGLLREAVADRASPAEPMTQPLRRAPGGPAVMVPVR